MEWQMGTTPGHRQPGAPVPQGCPPAACSLPRARLGLSLPLSELSPRLLHAEVSPQGPGLLSLPPCLARQARWDRQALPSSFLPASFCLHSNAAGRGPQRDSDRGAGLSRQSHLQPLRSPPLHRGGNRGSVRLDKKFVTMLRTRPRSPSPSRTCWLPAGTEEGLITRGPTPGVSAPSRVPARRPGTWKPHVRAGRHVALRA